MIKLEKLIEKSKPKTKYYSQPFPHFIIDDFLPAELSSELINDSAQLFDKNTLTIHGNRKFINNTSILFKTLLGKSSCWKLLHTYFSSQDFFNEIKTVFYKYDDEFCKKHIKKQNILIKNIIKEKNSNLKFKKIGDFKIEGLGFNAIIGFVVWKVLTRLKFKFILVISEFVKQKKIAQLLFDVSLAGNGYGRSSHRDSDNRLFVFLLYLSEFNNSDTGIGGDLEILSYQPKDKSVINSHSPKQDQIQLVSTIKPKQNRLVVFLNSDISIHAVSKMEGRQTERLFCYGGFTMLNKPIIKTDSKSKTEFHLYF